MPGLRPRWWLLLAALGALALLRSHFTQPPPAAPLASAPATTAPATSTTADPARAIAAREAPVLATASYRLEGEVLDGFEHPVGGVRVTVDGARTAVTERDGSFAFDDVAEGRHALIAEKALWYGETDAVLGDGTDPVSIHLAIGSTLAIKVVDPAGAPIAGAEIESGAASATSGADGIAHLRGAELGEITVRASAPGRARVREHFDAGDDPATAVEHTIVMGPGALVAGTVVDEAGKPVPGAFVIFTAGEGEWHRFATADDHGAWQIEDAGPGDYTARASSDTDVETADLALRLDGVHPRTDVVIHVEAGGEISGRVVDVAGHPVAATVQVGTHVEEAGADGRFTVTGLAPDTYDVAATTPRAGMASVKIEVPRKAKRTVQLIVQPASIAGIVVDPQGQPIENASIVCRSADALGFNSVRSDDHGRFDLGGLPPGEYVLEAERDEQDGGRGTVVHVTTDARDVRIVLPELATITGRVVRAGVPLDYFRVAVAEDPGDLTRDRAEQMLTPNGTFIARGLPAGTRSVMIVAPGLAPKVIENVHLAAGQTVDLGEISVAP